MRLADGVSSSGRPDKSVVCAFGGEVQRGEPTHERPPEYQVHQEHAERPAAVRRRENGRQEVAADEEHQDGDAKRKASMNAYYVSSLIEPLTWA